MSPLPSRIVLDNTVISSLHEAGALARVLTLWNGQWLVPLQVRDEAAARKVYGPESRVILNRLESQRTLEYVSPDPSTEGATFEALQRTRGQAESAAIAIAYARGCVVATDDRRAARSCERLKPPVLVVTTEALLTIAVTDGLLTDSEAQDIWAATGIHDPSRGLGRPPGPGTH